MLSLRIRAGRASGRHRSGRIAPTSIFAIEAGTKSTHPRDTGGRSSGVETLEDSLIILIVEDDQSIQGLVEEALTEGGFDAAIAASGEEAASQLQASNGKYRALVTDIDLPGTIDGWEVAKQARELDPEFPIIYMTGAGADQWASHGVPNSILLTKPFAPAQLVTAVSQLLNSSPVSS
jgi:DNA-binding NtrC family response regulator